MLTDQVLFLSSFTILGRILDLLMGSLVFWEVFSLSAIAWDDSDCNKEGLQRHLLAFLTQWKLLETPTDQTFTFQHQPDQTEKKTFTEQSWNL